MRFTQIGGPPHGIHVSSSGQRADGAHGPTPAGRRGTEKRCRGLFDVLPVGVLVLDLDPGAATGAYARRYPA